MMKNTNKATLVLACIFMLALILPGCALFDGSSANSSESEPSPPVAEYYYGDFDDVPIPKEMSSDKSGYIVLTQGGVKTGLQVFSGRVEINSLNRAMHDYMLRDGWTLTAGSQGSKQTVLVFGKGNRICVLINTDGSFNTNMQVHVTQQI